VAPTAGPVRNWRFHITGIATVTRGETLPKEPPEVQELFDRIAACLPLGVPLDAPGFRSVGVLYANEGDLISGEGAAYYGGRWNPPGIQAVYASLDPVTATRESFQEFIKYGFKPDNIRPRVMVGVKLKLRCLLDLRSPSVRRKVGFRLDDLLQEDWHGIQSAGQEAWTQAIGRGCGLAGFEGLLVPSVTEGRGANVVVFPDRLRPESSIEPIGADELPPHPSKWPR